MSAPIPAPSARVVDQLSGEVAAGITPVTKDVVWRAKSALEGVTDGPWVTHDMADHHFNSTNDSGWWWVWKQAALPYYGGVMEMTSGDGDGSVGTASITDAEDGEQERRDAEFIAAARTLVPELVAEVEAVRARLDAANEALLDAREDRNLFADRADLAERELARLQEQQVRVDEQASRIQALEQALANAVSERDTARAGVAGRGQK